MFSFTQLMHYKLTVTNLSEVLITAPGTEWVPMHISSLLLSHGLLPFLHIFYLIPRTACFYFPHDENAISSFVSSSYSEGVIREVFYYQVPSHSLPKKPTKNTSPNPAVNVSMHTLDSTYFHIFQDVPFIISSSFIDL